MKRFLEWLSTPEGPDLIDSHSDPPTVPYMALAVGLDPDHLYRNPKGVVARNWFGLQAMLHQHDAFR